MNHWLDNDITVDTRPYIEELQQYLRTWQQRQQGYSDVPADGIFGPQTTAALRQFQQQSGLPDTGKADRETWDALAVAGRPVFVQPEALCVFPPDMAPLRPGDESDGVYFLQLMLQTLHSVYPNLPPVDTPSGVYTADTARAIAAVQRLSGLPETGVTDQDTWNAVAGLYHQL